jgi:hypothetical protein
MGRRFKALHLFHSVQTDNFRCKLPNVGAVVKDPYMVLRQKEQDIARVEKEIQALLAVIPLLTDSVPFWAEHKIEAKAPQPSPSDNGLGAASPSKSAQT